MHRPLSNHEVSCLREHCVLLQQSQNVKEQFGRWTRTQADTLGTCLLCIKNIPLLLQVQVYYALKMHLNQYLVELTFRLGCSKLDLSVVLGLKLEILVGAVWPCCGAGKWGASVSRARPALLSGPYTQPAEPSLLWGSARWPEPPRPPGGAPAGAYLRLLHWWGGCSRTGGPPSPGEGPEENTDHVWLLQFHLTTSVMSRKIWSI